MFKVGWPLVTFVITDYCVFIVAVVASWVGWVEITVCVRVCSCFCMHFPSLFPLQLFSQVTDFHKIWYDIPLVAALVPCIY